MRSVILIFFTLELLVVFGTCKRILGIYGHPGKSHQIMGEIILKKLAERGHEVTMVSTYPLQIPIPNYKDVYLEGLLEEITKEETIYLEMEKQSLSNFIGMFHLIKEFADKTFDHSAMKELINSGQKFDLIIMDWFCKDSELIYANIFEAPIILTSSFGTQNEMNYLVNNPEPYSYVPTTGFAYTDEMSYLERLGNTLAKLFIEGMFFYNKINQQRILYRHFEHPPTIDELRGNVDLVFSNSHPVIESPRPFLPNIIPVGGIHVREPEPLPQDLKDFLDKSVEGVVYFSLGSHMKTSVLPENILNSLLWAFSRLPQKVLLKWEKDETPKLPWNVMVGKWMPQNSILAHPNVKVFITHGGLMSKIEAIYHATPMIGIPLFGDQKTNVMHSVHKGIALQLYLSEISEDTLYNALNEIIYNTSYSDNIKKMSLLLKDQPMKPIDTAIYWAEFVMRHNGSKHLQTKGMKLYRFQNLLLDVVPVIIGVVVLITLIFTKLCCVMFKLICRKRTHVKTARKLKKN